MNRQQQEQLDGLEVQRQELTMSVISLSKKAAHYEQAARHWEDACGALQRTNLALLWRLDQVETIAQGICADWEGCTDMEALCAQVREIQRHVDGITYGDFKQELDKARKGCKRLAGELAAAQARLALHGYDTTPEQDAEAAAIADLIDTNVPEAWERLHALEAVLGPNHRVCVDLAWELRSVDGVEE